MHDRLIELLSGMIDIESVNPSSAGVGSGEAAVAAYVGEVCRRMGLSVEMREALPGRPSALGHLDVPGARGHLLLVAHLDTVPAGDMPEPFTARVENGRVIGRGACDDKGPMASLLVAMERLVARRGELRTNVTVAGVADEEYGGTGAIDLVRSGVHYDGVVIAEATDLQAVIAHQGGKGMILRVLGKSAHSSRPDLGENAIVRAAEAIRFLDEVYTPRLAGRRHPLTGPPTMSITMVQGGVAPNIIPPECRLTLSRRSIPGETEEGVRAELEAAVDELRRLRPDLRMELEDIEGWQAALDTPPDAAVSRAALRAVRAVLGSGELGGVPWGSDGSIFFHLGGIPCAVLGPGSATQEAHTAHESIGVEEMALCARIYEELALGFVVGDRGTG